MSLYPPFEIYAPYVCYILEGSKRHHGNHFIGDIPLTHETEYAVCVVNRRHARVEASVEIDGKLVGKWLVPPRSSVQIERPVSVNKKFTFLKASAPEAKEAGIVEGDAFNGMIKVTCKLEQILDIDSTFGSTVNQVNTFGLSSSSSGFSLGFGGGAPTNGVSAGATGLGAISHQQFQPTAPITNFDPNFTREFNYRLVCKNTNYTPLQPVEPDSEARINELEKENVQIKKRLDRLERAFHYCRDGEAIYCHKCTSMRSVIR
jgi:hypothetical protein